MNKFMLLLATSLYLVNANAAPSVYAKLFMTADYIDAKSDNTDISKVDEDGDSYQVNSNSSRIGFKGSHPITEDSDVIYQLEYGVSVDGSAEDTLTQRTTFLGVKNKNFGDFRFGNLDSPIDDINNVTVNQGYWDNLGSSSNRPILAKSLTMTDSNRIDNSVKWISPLKESIPIQLTAMYAADEELQSQNQESEDGYGISLTYNKGNGLTAAVAYDKDLDISGDVLRSTLSYDKFKIADMPLNVAALYQLTDINGSDKKEKGFIVSAELELPNFARPAFIYTQYDNVSDLSGNKGLDSNQLVLGGKYLFKKNVIAHAYAGYNKAEDSNVETEVTAIGAGLEYKF